MTSVKVKFRKSRVKGQKGSCFIQLIHKRVMTTIAIGVKLYENEWDNAKGCILFKKVTSERARELLLMKEQLEKTEGELNSIVRELESSRSDYTLETIIEAYKGHGLSKSFFALMEYRISNLEESGQERTAQNYRGALRMFKKFRQNKDIPAGNISELLVEEFEVYLKMSGNSLNTISYYMRILKAVYNFGVKKKWIKENLYPFQGAFTGTEKTAKRAVDDKTVQKLVELNLNNKPGLDLARDIFLFSVYTRGMCFIDIASLSRENINGNILVYKRHKTNQRIQVALEDCTRSIIQKYADLMDGLGFLFPLLYHPGRNKVTQYATSLHIYNERLEKISQMLGLALPFTSYTSRHTWATLAKENGVKIGVISEAMGHTSEETTRIYLALLNNSALDEANGVVINSVSTFNK